MSGFTEIASEELNTERVSYADVVLDDRLRSALAQINPKVPVAALEEAVGKVVCADSPSLFKNNRRFHKLLTDGVDVEYHAEGRVVHDKVWLIDFSKLGNI